MVNDYDTSCSINNLYSAFTPLLDVIIEGEMVTMSEISLNDLETMLRLIEEQRLYSIYQCYGMRDWNTMIKCVKSLIIPQNTLIIMSI